MADVFISYAREDRDLAEQFAQALTAHGWSVWWDRRIKIGKHFSRVIEGELDAARCVVVLWSRHAVDSEWVLNEASEGARRQVLVPVRIDDSRLPLEFRRLQTADLTAWRSGVESTELNDCIAAIGEYIADRTNTIADQEPAHVSLTVDPLAQTTVDLKTTVGTISLEFRPDVAPNHVRNFIDLARSRFYDHTKFHRVIPGFMIQGGDPNTISGTPATWGTGGSAKNIRAEFNTLPHLRGTLSMARSQHPDSASSQFFICDAPSQFLDGQYTVFGKVRSGMDVVDKIAKAPRNAKDQPHEPVTIIEAVVHSPQR